MLVILASRDFRSLQMARGNPGGYGVGIPETVLKGCPMSEMTKCPECGGTVVPVLPDPPKEPRACLRCQSCGKEFEWLEAQYTERWQDG